MTTGQYSVTGGCWALPQAVQTEGAPTLTIAKAAPDFALVSGTPGSGMNWILPEALTVTGAWLNPPRRLDQPWHRPGPHAQEVLSPVQSVNPKWRLL